MRVTGDSNYHGLLSPRTFAVSIAASFLLLFGVACGSDDDDSTPGAGSDTTPAAASTMTSGDGTTTTSTGNGDDDDEGTPDMGAMATTASGMDTEELGVVGACLQENTDAEMVEDMRAGDTASAEAVYTTCLEDVLPETVVANMEPVIDEAAACGSTASQDLSDDDIAAIESGDEDVINQLSADTLSCLSDSLGIPIS